jgi:hypothetical protein
MQRGLSMDIGDGSVNPKRSPSQDSHKANLWQAQLPRLSNTSSRHCAALSKASLDLSRSQLGLQQLLDIVNELQSNETVTMCDLSHNGLGEAGIQAINRCLTQNTTLVNLNLSDNNIHNDSIIVLAHALQKNQTLQTLSLANNHCGDLGACELAKALGAGSTGYGSISSITSLNLLDNPINAAGGQAMLEALQPNRNIARLALPHSIGYKLHTEIQQQLTKNWIENTRNSPERAALKKQQQRDRFWQQAVHQAVPKKLEDRRCEKFEYSYAEWTDPVLKDTMVYLALLQKKAKVPYKPEPPGGKRVPGAHSARGMKKLDQITLPHRPVTGR